MNKKILGGIAIFAIAALSVFNVNFNSQSNKLSDISLANVEALAEESGSPGQIICGKPYDRTCKSMHGYVIPGLEQKIG
jgi:hypothetical protein